MSLGAMQVGHFLRMKSPYQNIASCAAGGGTK